MLVLPYRAKNPPPRPPYCTYGLIVANVLTYIVTSEDLLFVPHNVVEWLAVSHAEFTPLRILTAMFLHGNLLHLLGNMLFLWIFGAAVEGRLGPARFLGLYLLSGAFGDVVQNVTLGRLHPHQWNLGASGAIMGLAGAYVYMFPFAAIRVLWGFNLRLQVTDWSAQWVVLYFLTFDIIDGVLFQGLDGVGHFVHLGGAIFGFFLPMLLGMHRDSEQTSAAQAMRVDAGGDLSILALHEIEALIESNPDDPEYLLLFCQKAIKRQDIHGPERCFEMISERWSLMVEGLDPAELAQVALLMSKTYGVLPARFWMRLGGRLEATGHLENSLSCFERVLDIDQAHPDAEMAFVKAARLCERMQNFVRAGNLYQEQLHRFPTGSQATFAEGSLRRLGITRGKWANPARTADPEDDLPPALPADGPDYESSFEDVRSMGGHGSQNGNFLQPLIQRPHRIPQQRAAFSAIEPGYVIGETSGMALRPIGPPSADEPE